MTATPIEKMTGVPCGRSLMLEVIEAWGRPQMFIDYISIMWHTHVTKNRSPLCCSTKLALLLPSHMHINSDGNLKFLIDKWSSDKVIQCFDSCRGMGSQFHWFCVCMQQIKRMITKEQKNLYFNCTFRIPKNITNNETFFLNLAHQVGYFVWWRWLRCGYWIKHWRELSSPLQNIAMGPIRSTWDSRHAEHQSGTRLSMSHCNVRLGYVLEA